MNHTSLDYTSRRNNTVDPFARIRAAVKANRERAGRQAQKASTQK